MADLRTPIFASVARAQASFDPAPGEALLVGARQAYVTASGPPGVREIGTALAIGSNNAVEEHLRFIEKKGYVAQAKAKARNAWWPTRDLDGAPIRWRLTYERTDA